MSLTNRQNECKLLTAITAPHSEGCGKLMFFTGVCLSLYRGVGRVTPEPLPLPSPRQNGGTPPSSRQDRGTPPSPPQISHTRTGSAAGGMPLAVTQEDFLVTILFQYFKLVTNLYSSPNQNQGRVTSHYIVMMRMHYKSQFRKFIIIITDRIRRMRGR